MTNLETYNIAKSECMAISDMIKNARKNQEWWLLPELKRKSEIAFNYRQDCYKKLSLLEIVSQKQV